jgi:HEPN domain-containing protein
MVIEEVKDWLDYADADLDGAKWQDKAFKRHNHIICFHCQQAVEKYIKAFLSANGIQFRKIHDLSSLTELCLPVDSSFRDFFRFYIHNFITNALLIFPLKPIFS